MATNFDVFGNLNKFLEKADEDSFKYDDSCSSTPDTSLATESKEAGINTIANEDHVDFCSPALADETPKTNGSRKTRKRNGTAKTTTLDPEESMDLTDESFKISPPKRSRRAADAIDSAVTETVNLAEPEENNNSRRRSKRNNRKTFTSPAPKVKAPKAKKISYKEALKLINAPIPQFPDRPLEKALKVQSPTRPTQPVAPTTHCDVDLTGDIMMGAMHSSEPLFQKVKLASKPAAHVDDSSDDENDDFDLDALRVKVKVKNSIKIFTHRRHQRYYDLYKVVSEQEEIPIGNIFLYDKDKRIDHDDTPHTTDYKISTILTCRVMESQPGMTLKHLSKKNQIELKFQSDKWKKPIALKVLKFDDFATAIKILCEQVTFKHEQITLYFDGDEVLLSQTPMDLEFDGGEILDCRVKL